MFESSNDCCSVVVLVEAKVLLIKIQAGLEITVLYVVEVLIDTLFVVEILVDMLVATEVLLNVLVAVEVLLVVKVY